jgi:iron complex outermembrane recepter protein
LRGSIRFEKKNWLIFQQPFVDFGVDYAFSQEHPSRFETPTDDYLLVDFRVGGTSNLLSQRISYGITVDNLFDVKYIDHLSTLKNLNYYNMGRNVVFWVKIPFQANL